MTADNAKKLNVSKSLLEKYSTTGPRYTSYPTAPVWTENYTAKTHVAALQTTNDTEHRQQPLSLYVHLPFCETRCLFCGCNVVITKQKDKAEEYLDYLFREIEITAAHMDLKRPVVQSHWGGGTPTYLSPEQMDKLFRFQKDIFNFQPDAEVAIEVDPRVTSKEQIQLLRELGFNRVSLGVQDFEPAVQEEVHRVQPIEMTAEFTEYCRGQGFSGINFDLIYGLPHQTLATFKNTIQEVLRLSPDRIALYNFAYVPWLSPHQKQLPQEAMPGGEEKFKIFQYAIEALTGAGYIYIGMDHFAKPDDELAVALKNGTLHRNFMGYTVKQKDSSQPDPDLYGFGVSAISGLSRYYAQNVKKLSQYYEAIQQKSLPVYRGYMLSDDDVLRRQVILSILCQGDVNFKTIEAQFNIPDFQAYFLPALKTLKDTADDGLIEWTCDGFSLTPLGRVFSRNIAMPFDAYLENQQKQPDKPTFSKTL